MEYILPIYFEQIKSEKYHNLDLFSYHLVFFPRWNRWELNFGLFTATHKHTCKAGHSPLVIAIDSCEKIEEAGIVSTPIISISV